MKKFKTFIVTAICAVCLCLVFSGCASDGNYVYDSFTVSSVYHSEYSKTLTVSGSFKVNVNSRGAYNVEYELCQTDNNGNILAKGKYIELLDINGGEHTVNIYEHISTPFTSEKVILRNVTITLNSSKSDYSGYAIGFGLVGVLILGGLVTVFVLDKLGKFNKFN